MDLAALNADRAINMIPGSGFVVGVHSFEMASALLEWTPMVTSRETDEIYFYHEGKYHPNGEQFIKKVLTMVIGPLRNAKGNSVLTNSLTAEIIAKVKGLTYNSMDIFDKDRDLVNMRNGLYNWKTGELYPHDPDYPCLIQIPVEYNNEADCPNIKEMLSKVVSQENIIKLREFMAYCLYRGYPIQVAFILLGPGGSGKSIFISLCRKLVGDDNYATVSMHDIENDRFAAADLHAKLLNGFGDMEQTTLPNINKLKMLVSGSDEFRAQHKHKAPFNFINYAKFLFSTNRLPLVKDDTTGFYRRMEIVMFEHVFKGDELDRNIIVKLTTPDELSGLFNWVIVTLEPLLRRGEFTNSTDIETITKLYRGASDPMSVFIDDCVVESANGSVLKTDMYEAYKKLCNKYKVKPLKPNWFSQKFSQKVPYVKADYRPDASGASTPVWKFVELVDNTDE